MRPEAFSLASETTPSERRVEVKIETIEALGYEMLVYFPITVQKVTVDIETVKEEEMLQHSSSDVSLFAARLPVIRNLDSGLQLSLAIDTRQVYLFELDRKAIS